MSAPSILVRSITGYEDQAALDALIEGLFAALPAAGRIGPGKTVLLKPNLLAKHPPEHAVTTHPAIVRAVARAVKRRSPARIILADSSGGVYNPAMMQATYNVSGLAKVCAEEGLELYTGCKWGERAVENGVAAEQFTLIEPVLEADVIIDLPKLKTHVMTGCTAAVKNLFGCIPGLQKAEWHMRFPDRERFGQMLVDLLLHSQAGFCHSGWHCCPGGRRPCRGHTPPRRPCNGQRGPACAGPGRLPGHRAGPHAGALSGRCPRARPVRRSL